MRFYSKGEGKESLRGILPVNKPRGVTSHDVVDRARKALGLRKVGHTGTLDPLASGLLLLCLGGATRFAGYLTGQDKTYQAVIGLGLSTSTDDTEGEAVFKYEGDLESLVTKEKLNTALKSFTGVFSQQPPDFSSKKVDGVPAYVLARRGEKPNLKPVAVRIDFIRLLSVRLPQVEIEVGCSAGTYLRSLARDLGSALGCGGHLSSLDRTSVGDFTLDKAITLDFLKTAGIEKIVKDFLAPVEKALCRMPAVMISDEAREKIYYGQPVGLEACEVVPALDHFPGDNQEARIHDKGNRFLGVGLISPAGASAGGVLRPKRLMMESF